MFVAALLCQVILATAAFAVPTANERHAHRVARRAAGLTRQSLPHQLAEFSENPVVSDANGLDNATQATVVYSTNWAGALLSEKKATYNGVTGTFVIPTPTVPSGGSGVYRGAAWVGIDGVTCGTTLLQTGIDFAVNGSRVTYFAWYHWYPADAYDFSGITFQPGDTVTLTVAAMSKTNGTVSIKNHRTGKRVLHNFSGQPSLCKYDAEWVIEDLGNSTLSPFANFGKVTFTDATAHTLSGKTVGPANAQQIDILKSNKAITKVTTGPKSVTITYTGQ
ncbi:aspergillopepsin [Ganoderma leucocontextum]|nr:aspergillopepsin [Ganoderma leucocontextum]